MIFIALQPLEKGFVRKITVQYRNNVQMMRGNEHTGCLMGLQFHDTYGNELLNLSTKNPDSSVVGEIAHDVGLNERVLGFVSYSKDTLVHYNVQFIIGRGW